MAAANAELLELRPTSVIRDWGDGQAFRLSDAQSGVIVFGATGSGKTSGPAKHLAMGYLAHGFGGLVLCAKKEERAQWQKWAKEVGRERDLVIVDKAGTCRFNFLEWEASRPGEGGGLTINIVALLDEIATTIAAGAGAGDDRGGDNRFFADALHHMNANLVDLPLFAGLSVSLPLMRSIVNSAPYRAEDLKSDSWQQQSACATILREADNATQKAGDEVRADFDECRSYWLQEFPALSEKTRSIITLMFSMLVRPLITRPLRRLFSSDTNITPEATFAGRIIIIDLPVQEFRLTGRIANLVWKYCFQVAVLRRPQAAEGKSLRPVFLWCDEAQNFVSEFDAEYQAVARSAGGCTVYLTQNRESFRRVLGNDDTVDALLGNLQNKFLCQNSSVATNEWASDLLGERYTDIMSISSSINPRGDDSAARRGLMSAGTSVSEDKRAYVEPALFATLKRGGAAYGNQVECIVYKGGHQFPTATANGMEALPYKLLTFNQ